MAVIGILLLKLPRYHGNGISQVVENFGSVDRRVHFVVQELECFRHPVDGVIHVVVVVGVATQLKAVSSYKTQQCVAFEIFYAQKISC